MYYITVSSFLQMVDEIFCKIISVYDIEKKAARERTAFSAVCDCRFYANVTAYEIVPLEIIQP